MIKLLIGGSPCTYWSIAQKNNRETQAEGLGWELFKNYLIAKEKFKPDFFLYENNKSASQAIKDQIKQELGVWDGTLFTVDNGVRYIEINSALVSAQNRQRFYVHNCGEVQQPEDREIKLGDIIEPTTDIPINIVAGGKSNAVRATCYKDTLRNLVANDYDTRTCCATPINICDNEKSRTIKAQYQQNSIANFVTNGGHDATGVAEPIRVGSLPRPNGELSTSAGMRIYSADGKGRCLIANGGGQGAKTGLYAIPTDKPVYEVKDGFIAIKGKQYPIKLADGHYTIRKLTVTECARLQTMPDNYCKAVSDSQAYKGLGNGWTAEVIIHILNYALKDVPKDEEIVVLSMYDGIGTGRYCLDKMGFTNVKYYAYEIDKYAMTVAKDNYPDIIECGDAFQVRDNNWSIYCNKEE